MSGIFESLGIDSGIIIIILLILTIFLLDVYKRQVPDDADCLFIDSPSTDISEDEKTAIIDYLENGGKAMIFSDYTTEDLSLIHI